MKFSRLFSSITILLVLACGPPKPSKPPRSQEIISFVNAALDSIQVVPGTAMALVDSTGVVLTRGFGYSDLEMATRANEQTNFYIASTTKPFVGLLATLLHDKGEIDLDTDITQYRPFKEFEQKAVFQNITIRELLSHQSGIDNPYLSFRLSYSGSYTRTDILRTIEQETFKKETGKTFAYTNFGYYLFSVLLEEELGAKWQDLLDEHVFTPLNMGDATAYISENSPETLAKPYHGTLEGNLKKTATQKSDATMHSAGGLVMNAKDAANFLMYYVNKGVLDGKRIHSDSLVTGSYTKIATTGNAIGAFNAHGYGMGWLLGRIKGEDMVNHQGGYIGFNSSITFFPNQKLGLAIFTNHHELGRALLNTVGDFVFESYLGDASDMAQYRDSLLTQLAERLKQVQKVEREENEKSEKELWNLSFPFQAYEGSYYNIHDGIVTIAWDEEGFKVSSGNLACLAVPYKDKDCFAVELITTSKKIICFDVGDDKVQSIHFRDKVFHKLDSINSK